ncbi:MAG: glycosyl transferase group 1 [Phycisphaerales bacterium]|nr:glycosyl transferase group 1 [Phycisphaerales bacterium]
MTLRMRVHFLITDLEIGGTPRVVKELAIRLRPLGFETAVACLSPWGPVADELVAAGVSVTAFDARGVRQLPATVAKVRRWAADADVVFSFLLHANAVATLALRGSNTPLIQSIQTTQPRPRWHWWVHGIVGRSARKIVVPTASIQQIAGERSALPAHQFVVIPNAVDLASNSIGARPPRDGGPWRVGFIGRLDPVKCVPDLVRAVARLPDAELHVYGDGPARHDIEATAHATGLNGRLVMHGRVTSSADALASIDTLVLPSEAEGFGLVLIEAMAAGVPVIATRVPGIVDVVRHGETGLLVPVHDPAALAAAIDSVRRDAALRARLAAAAFADVRERFTWDIVLPAYERVLRATAAASVPSPGIAGRGLG